MDNIFSPRFVLILFESTTCAALFMRIITPEQFLPALMLVLGYFYGSKSGQRDAEAKAAGLETHDEV